MHNNNNRATQDGVTTDHDFELRGPPLRHVRQHVMADVDYLQEVSSASNANLENVEDSQINNN